jgi:hypothetical protein
VAGISATTSGAAPDEPHARRLEQARQVAHRDQQDAAAPDLLLWFSDIAIVGRALGVLDHVIPGAREPQFAERVIHGAALRLRGFCPHVDISTPQPIIASLSHRWGCCRNCTSSLLHTPIDYDGLCDLCGHEAEGNWFYDVVTAINTSVGAMLVVANVCTDCRALAGPLPEIDAA